MYKPDKMRLNKFVDVAIPKNSDYFARMAGNLPTIGSQFFSGDEVVPQNDRKVDVLADIDAYDRMMQRKEAAEAMHKEDS